MTLDSPTNTEMFFFTLISVGVVYFVVKLAKDYREGRRH